MSYGHEGDITVMESKPFFNKSEQPGSEGDLAVTSVTLLIERIQVFVWLGGCPLLSHSSMSIPSKAVCLVEEDLHPYRRTILLSSA